MKKKRDPNPYDRETPQFWVREIQATVKRNQSRMDQFARFSRWYKGDLSDLIDPDAAPQADRSYKTSLDNMHAFVTDTAVANLFFRCPRVVVRCPMMNTRGVFSPGLARVETTLTNDTLEQSGYFRRKRRQILDARLGPYGVLKITYDRDIAVDTEKIEEHREAANLENQMFLARGTKMVAEQDQLHSVHIDAHEKLLAMAQRGEVQIPKAAVRYIKQHMKMHEEMRSSEVPTETVRDCSVVIRRVNPVNWFHDMSVDDMADCRWFAETYLARRVDILANTGYALEAREAASEAPSLWIRNGIPVPMGLGDQATYDGADPLVRVYEVVDLVDGQVREFFEDGSIMARNRPYKMQSVQPSGPYSFLVFRPDPFEATGVPPPVNWEAEQAATTALASVMVSAATQTLPRGLFDARYIDPKKVEEIIAEGTGAWIPINQLPSEKKIADVFAPGPEVEIAEQNFAVHSMARSGIMQRSGFGAQKLQSGDKSQTATEASIIAGASDALSEDQASIVDDSCVQDVKMIARIQRLVYELDKVVEIVGPEAELHWPDGFSDRDIKNDRGISIVPGSSRRRNTSIDAKLSLEGLGILATLVAMPPGAGKTIALEIARRWFEDQGIAGLDWDAMAQEDMMMQMLQKAAAGGEPGAPGGDGDGDEAEGPKETPMQKKMRPSEMQEPSRAGQMQGMANMGGGRVPTGASGGDKMRLMR